MVNEFLSLTLLAQAENWQQMGNRFRPGGSSLDSADVVIFAGVTAAFFVGLLLVSKFCRRGANRPFHSHWRLFLQLCRAHKITWRESWLLWRVARAQGTKHPAAIFLQPDRFSPTQVPAKFSRWQLQLNDLRLRLFEPREIQQG